MKFKKNIHLLLLSVIVYALISPLSAQVTSAGTGSYTIQKPDHRKGPSNSEGDAVMPQLSDAFKASGKPVPTHEFWSSVIFPFQVGDRVNYSYNMYAHPNGIQLTNDGLEVTRVSRPNLTPLRIDGKVVPSEEDPIYLGYGYQFSDPDITISIPNLDADQTKLDSSGDWHTTVLWKDKNSGTESANNMRATFAMGWPYVYVELDTYHQVTITLKGGTRLWYEADGILALSREDFRQSYAIYLPENSSVSYSFTDETLRYVTSIQVTLPESSPFLTVGTLPDQINDVITYAQSDGGVPSTIPVGTPLSQIPPYISGQDRAIAGAIIFRTYFKLYGGYLTQEGGYDARLPEGYALSPDLLDILKTYKEHAFTIPTETTTSWNINKSNATMTASYTVTSEKKQTTSSFNNEALTYSDSPLLVLYPHQWQYTTGSEFLSYTYKGAKGLLKTLESNTFTLTHPLLGVIPEFPNVLSESDNAQLQTYLSAVTDNANLVAPSSLLDVNVLPTYTSGKEMARLAALLPIAKQQNQLELFETLKTKLKAILEDWFDASDWVQDTSDSHSKRYFYYDETWAELTGYPADFAADTELNDHHFHYGYFVMAMVIMAQYDRDWALGYAPMVNLLIKDVANWDRTDTQFPFLRYFDPYMGHAYANGHTNADAGANQESSSESMNFSAAAALWGKTIENEDIENLGLFLYNIELYSIQNYWFDTHDIVFPKDIWVLKDAGEPGQYWATANFTSEVIGINWNSKVDYATFFALNPQFIQGINFLPITPASLYLAHDDEELENNLAFLETTKTKFRALNWSNPADEEIEKKFDYWSDIIWQVQSFLDPDAAYQNFQTHSDYLWENAPGDGSIHPIRGEKGDSKAHTFHTIASLKALGKRNFSITATTPFNMVFDEGPSRNYVIFNPNSTTENVTFSDGATIQALPYSTLRYTASSDDNSGSGSGGGSTDNAPTDNLTITNLLIGPNPYRGSGTLRLEAGISGTLEAVEILAQSLTGKKVWQDNIANPSLTNNKVQIPLTGWVPTNGVYTLSITFKGDGETIQKRQKVAILR